MKSNSLALLTALRGLARRPGARQLPPEAIVHPKPDSWPTFHGDYSGRHYSPLKEINAENVHNLTLAWVNQINMTPGANIGGPGPEPSASGLRQHPMRAAAGGRCPLHHRAEHGARHRRPHRPRDLEVHLERFAGLRTRQSRRGNLRRLALLRDLRQPPGFARHQDRQGALEQTTGGREARLLLLGVSARDQEPRDRRRGRRFSRRAELRGSPRSRNRRRAVAFLDDRP